MVTFVIDKKKTFSDISNPLLVESSAIEQADTRTLFIQVSVSIWQPKEHFPALYRNLIQTTLSKILFFTVLAQRKIGP